MTDTLAPDEKLCPFCAETIKKAAVKCRYCHSKLADTPTDAAIEPPPAVPVEQSANAALVDDHADPGERESAAEPSPPPIAEETSQRPPRFASLRLMVGLLVLCLLLALGAAGSWVWAQRQDDSAVGEAISSQARENGVQKAATLTQQVLSYDWTSLDKDVKASEAVLAPSFRKQYAKTMEGVRAQTIKNQVKLSASVVASSVVSASADKVVALVFVNQVTTAKGTKNQKLDQNRVLVTLTRSGGDWRVSNMKAF